MTHKNRKNYEISCFEVMDFFLRVDEGFSCSSDVLYGGLGIIKLQFYQKNIKFFFSCKFLVIKTVDPDWIGIQPNAGSGFGWGLNESGSETLLGTIS
jgi:hypothetical protein